jgi:hypothetical protein
VTGSFLLGISFLFVFVISTSQRSTRLFVLCALSLAGSFSPPERASFSSLDELLPPLVEYGWAYGVLPAELVERYVCVERLEYYPHLVFRSPHFALDLIMISKRGYAVFHQYFFGHHQLASKAYGISSEHNQNGIAIISGGDVEPKNLIGAEVVDIAPTISGF